MDKSNIIDYILPCHFLASVEIYSLYFSGQCTWEAHENYQKRSIRNRTKLNSDQGPVSFSIPLKSGKNNQLPIREVQISYSEDWVKSMLQSICTNYGSTPFFEHYFPGINSILSSSPKLLWDLNLSLHEYLCSKLDISSRTRITSNWVKEISAPSKDFRNSFPIERKLKAYPQIHNNGQGFTHNLSVLDLLFNCGPEAQLYLSQSFEDSSQ